jgi:phenylpyruvate tautomerase PptA (4-oxalocrotonate tautomerase family)
MPLIRISHAAGKSPADRQAIADGVHNALVGTLNVPTDDRFQIISEQAAGSLIFDTDYLGIRRSADIVFIQVFLRRGRTVAMKQDFYRQVAQNLTANPGLAANDIFITLSENELADWSFGQGRAQYIEQPPQQVPAPGAAADAASVPASAGSNEPSTTAMRNVLAAAGSLLAAGFVALSLITLAHVVAPDRIDAALAKLWPSTDLIALASFTA